MANFLIIASYSPDGAKGLLKSGGTARVDAVKKTIEGIGGKLQSFHFAFGSEDAYVIAELPDNVAAAAIGLAVASTGLTSVKTVVLLTPAEIVLYDGSPGHPDLGVLWDLAERTRTTCFGTSAAFLASCMKEGVEPGNGRDLGALRSVGSGGEALGAETYEWGRSALGVAINEFYGQTECNLVLSGCGAIGVTRPGAIGKPVPGHEVAVIRDDGERCEVGEQGQIAILRPDPVMFLEYWDRPDATRDKFIGDWMTTGDEAIVDEDGYYHFVGREDDVITSAGYRIGPTEIEDCLIRHPAVALAAAVGKPDPLRTEIVKAFIVLKQGHTGNESLVREIQDFVKTRLAAHEYPREVAFVDALPMTATGKVIRKALRERG